MRMTDPTYLRTINDGLYSGILHKDNSSALPMGLVGMYDEALPPSSNVNERKKFLDFFAVWALLKKEVSLAFLIPLLEGWSEETIIYYINKYSKWFNSPISGKYVLYHERLRVFILQKISKNHFNACNETIIKISHDALSRRSGDEWENYALEYLSNHMLIPAIEKGDSSSLKSLGYDTTHWNRQVEISKGFEWSKRMLNNIMLWASKYDDNEVIECALNKVDLHHQEQNDAPRIVELVAQNDIETALDRIDKFGGQDKEGLQRKFILYMLCLMELTLLDSKDKPYRKEAIGKLLKHFDESKYRQSTCWSNYFPPDVVFEMAAEWSALGIDYVKVYSIRSLWDWEISVFQSACRSENANLIRELFPIIYAGTRDNDRDWICGCAAYDFGIDWVNTALQSDFCSESALLRYFVVNELMVELENHLNGISGKERLLSASLFVAELLLLNGHSKIDGYFFEIGEILDYFLDSDEELYNNSLYDLLFRYILVLISDGDAFSKRMAHVYFELHLKLGESREYLTNRSELDFLLSTVVIMVKLGINQERIEAQIIKIPRNSETRTSATTLLIYYSDWYHKSKSNNSLSDGSLDRMDFQDLIQLLASVVNVSQDEDLAMERYSCSLSNTRLEPRDLQLDLLHALEYKGINEKSEINFILDLGEEFEYMCREKFGVPIKKEYYTFLEQAQEKVPEKTMDPINWMKQWSNLKELKNFNDAVDFLDRLKNFVTTEDILEYIHLQIKFYKFKRRFIYKQELYYRIIRFSVQNMDGDYWILASNKAKQLNQLLIFIFKENRKKKQSSFSDYESTLIDLFKFIIFVIQNNAEKNRDTSIGLIHFFQNLKNDNKYSKEIEYGTQDLVAEYIEYDWLEKIIIDDLSGKFGVYDKSFLEIVQVKNQPNLYYALAFAELKNGNLFKFQYYLDLKLILTTKEDEKKYNQQLARNIRSEIYTLVEDKSSVDLHSFFKFCFSNSELNSMFKSILIQHSTLKLNRELLIEYCKWPDINIKDMELSLVYLTLKNLLNVCDDNEYLIKYGGVLNIQWAIDIKNSFSASKS